MPETKVVQQGPLKPFARLLVADEFRVETSGKLLAVGLYADNVVVFKVPRNAPPPSSEVPYGLDGLSLVVAVGGFEGEERVRITLGKNKPIEQLVPLRPGRSANLHLSIRPFTIASFGVKQLLVEFAGKKFKLPFEIRPEYIDPVEDPDAYLVPHHRPQKRVELDAVDAKIVAKPNQKAKPKAKPKRS